MENSDKIIMYSTSWCPDCIRAKYVFKKLGVEFTAIDVDKDQQAAEIVKEMNDGRRTVPTILFPDGSILVEPSNNELKSKLNQSKD